MEDNLRYSLVITRLNTLSSKIDDSSRKKERTTALVVSAVLNGFRAIDTGATTAAATKSIINS